MHDALLVLIGLLLSVAVHSLLEVCFETPLSIYDAEVGLSPADFAAGPDKAADQDGVAPLPLP